MKPLYSVLALSSLVVLAGCQSIQPFNGKTGYQRQQSNSNQVLLSYTMDAKSSDVSTQQKLKKACAKELGLAANTPIVVKLIDQKEFANLTQSQLDNTVPFTNTKRATFGLSSTPKLSNNSNTSTANLLGSQPATLKQITVQCLQP